MNETLSKKFTKINFKLEFVCGAFIFESPNPVASLGKI